MAIAVTAKQSIGVGEPAHVQGDAPEGSYSAVFEDDGDTGYFYALDYDGPGGQPIQNALHIYDVASITDKHLPSEIKIGWSLDSEKVDRKSTRLNSSHVKISYAVFCLKKKTRT